ncbi:MAG: hypothetical protein HYV04_06735 [Deltaproteobacteria bacterium]|nr:hypothetical protein [Deltaproteobacteria bacterium]
MGYTVRWPGWMAALLLCFALWGLAAAAVRGAQPVEKGRPSLFLPEERRIIREYFAGSYGALPPGLAKRGGSLPPGLQKQLQKKGRLPPGLQKRLEPIPADLEVRLPRIPEIWGRVILGPHVILIDRRTARILDIIENVIGLATER